MYSQIVFALGQLAAEMPYSILCAVVFYLLVRGSSTPVAVSLTSCSVQFYFPMGFNMDPSRAGYQFFVILITEVRPADVFRCSR